MPERAPVDVNLGPMVIAVPALGLQGSCKVTMYSSQLSVVFETEAGDVDIPTLRNLVRDLVANVVDSLGYVMGRAYEVEVTSVATDDDKYEVFGVEVPVLAAVQAERPFPVDQVVRQTLQSPPLQRALGELRRAITNPADTGFHCFRAIEAVRQHFAEPGDSDSSPSWERLRSALRLAREFFGPIEPHAVAQRHGEIVGMSDDERSLAMTIAWRVVDRFVILLDRGNAELGEEYPVLREA
jgi:hypothetical protein